VRVLSLGAGVQSSTLLLMACEGETDPLDAAIFADTGWEPAAVYDWLTEQLIPRARAAEIPLYVVHAYDDGRDVRARPWEMPLFVHNREGEPALLRRQCTSRFKIAPVRRQIRAILGHSPRRGDVEQWFGISFDESERMHDSDVAYIGNRYPLVDARMTRADCHNWLARRGLTAPRSACIGCPFHSDAAWLALKARPDEWAQAVEVDESLRAGDRSGAPKGFEGRDAFLHSARIPLVDVTLRNGNQLDLFGAGCDGGYCGV
jgi:hypothetical protein